MDLIDREEFYKRMRHAVSVAEEKELNGVVEILVGLVIPHLLTIPTVDAVPVVRCKDCKHAEQYTWNEFFCNKHQMMKNKNSYCSWGERKDGD